MNIKIERWKYQKILDTEFSIELPNETVYLFENFIRRSVKVIPGWTTWQVEQYNKPEEIYKYDCIIVYGNFENKIEKKVILISELEHIYNNEKDDLHTLVDFIATYTEHNERTKEQFDADFNKVLQQLTT